MASQGTLWIDRGYPTIQWPVVMVVGNHRMYKKDDKTTGGYPHLLAKEVRKAGWHSGRHLWKHCIPVPGTSDMYWVPNWYLQTYVDHMERVWTRITNLITEACSRKRYLGLRAAHRQLYIKPWVKDTMDRNYPDHHVLVGMGFPADRDQYIDDLTNTIMANYPAPQEMVDACWTSRPWCISTAGPSDIEGLPAGMTMWSPERTKTMAVSAADKYHWQILGSLEKIRKYLTPNPRTGRYDAILPLNAIRMLGPQARRSAAWDGPLGVDKGWAPAMESLARDLMDAPQHAMRNPLPDNPFRPYFLARVTTLIAHYNSKSYKEAKLRWWMTGDPLAPPQTIIKTSS